MSTLLTVTYIPWQQFKTPLSEPFQKPSFDTLISLSLIFSTQMNKKHNRAHTAAQENVKQINQDYYFPKMLKIAKEIVANCQTCSKAKCERHPNLQTISEIYVE